MAGSWPAGPRPLRPRPTASNGTVVAGSSSRLVALRPTGIDPLGSWFAASSRERRTRAESRRPGGPCSSRAPARGRRRRVGSGCRRRRGPAADAPVGRVPHAASHRCLFEWPGHPRSRRRSTHPAPRLPTVRRLSPAPASAAAGHRLLPRWWMGGGRYRDPRRALSDAGRGHPAAWWWPSTTGWLPSTPSRPRWMTRWPPTVGPSTRRRAGGAPRPGGGDGGQRRWQPGCRRGPADPGGGAAATPTYPAPVARASSTRRSMPGSTPTPTAHLGDGFLLTRAGMECVPARLPARPVVTGSADGLARCWPRTSGLAPAWWSPPASTRCGTKVPTTPRR